MKRRKNPRLKNGFGSIRYLGKGRTRPYAVFAPSSTTNNRGQYRYDKPIAYAKTWQDGFCLLVAYNSGNFKPGMVIDSAISQKITNEVVEQVLSVFAPNLSKGGLTFKEVFERFYDYKFNQEQKEFSKAIKASYNAGFKNCKAIHNKPIADLTFQELQKVIDDSPLGWSSKKAILMTVNQVFRYAFAFEHIDRDISNLLQVRSANDNEKGVAFTMDELRIIHKCKDHPIAKSILFMCLSGFRINEYKTLQIDIESNTMIGGSKTKAGKNRLVPIHPFIKPYIEDIKENPTGILSSIPAEGFRNAMYSFLNSVGIQKHTPHDTRHTFSYLCDKFKVDQIAKKRMIGHSFQDVTNAVYGHTDYDILYSEILKIPMDFLDF